MAHIVGLTDSYQESSIFVLFCQEVTEAINPIHFAKEPPDKNNKDNKTVLCALLVMFNYTFNPGF